MSEGPLVTIIDDDPDIREALSQLLETVNLRAVTYPSTAEFLASKRSSGPSCIVLDVRLPGVGGLEFQRRLAEESIPRLSLLRDMPTFQCPYGP